MAVLHYKLGEFDEAKSFLKALNTTNPKTREFFRRAQTEYPMEMPPSPYGSIQVGTIGELISVYNSVPYLYFASFIPWSNRILGGSVPKKPPVRGISPVKKSRARRKK